MALNLRWHTINIKSVSNENRIMKSENEQTFREYEKRLLPQDKKYYGCIMCPKGKENVFLKLIKEKTDITILSPIGQRYHKKRGKYSVVISRVVSGYLFFVTDDYDLNINVLNSISESVKVIKNDNNDWRLTGKAKEFVEELLNYKGIVRFSKSSFINGKLSIKHGFLNHFEDDICNIDKKHRTAKINIPLGDYQIEAWCGYEIVGEEMLCR